MRIFNSITRLIKTIAKLRNSRFWISAIVIFLIHVSLALFYKWHLGIDIEIDAPRNTWDFFWQTLSLHDLDSNMLKSLWYFHAQPPFFNIYGFIVHKITGDAQLQTMQYIQILLGGAMSVMIWFVLQTVVKNRIFAFICALFISLNPSIFLYEAFILYSLPVSFLVMLSILLLAKYTDKKRFLYLILFILTVNCLILTHGLYHIIILIPFIIIGMWLANEKWKKFLLYACLISLMSVGWYTKNYLEFGFFGSSSWFGSNLWRNVSQNYSEKELDDFYEEDIIEEVVVRKQYFDRPMSYANYGFNQSSDIGVLNADDYNNINMIAISQAYFRAAKNVIFKEPAHYFNNCLEAYGRFCQPSFNTGFVSRNRSLIPRHARVWSWLQGGLLFEGEPKWLSSFYSLLIPFCVIHFFIRLIFHAGISLRKTINHIRENSVAAVMIVYISYVSIVSSLFEYGENCRFKFSIEALILCYFLAIICFPLFRYLVDCLFRLLKTSPKINTCS